MFFNLVNKTDFVRVLVLSGTLFVYSFSVAADQLSLSEASRDYRLGLEAAVMTAQKNDPWQAGNNHSQAAVEARSVAAGSLPDPKLSVGLVNIAADSLDFGQEAMSMFRVSVAQSLPRGDSLKIRKKQLELMGSQYPFQRLDRKAKVAVTVGQLWLDAYKAQETVLLIGKSRDLFEQLADVAQASYSSAVGRSRQQDIVRAQLELTRLEDRLTMLSQEQEVFSQRLLGWLSDYFVDQYSQNQSTDDQLYLPSVPLTRKLPDIKLLNQHFYTETTKVDSQSLIQYLSRHPAVNALDQKIEASKAGIELAKQKYKPELGLSASYGYRDDDPMGIDRADLFSIGVTFDLPLFTSNRQDKQVQSAISSTAAVKTEKWLLLRDLIASFKAARAKLLRLNQRQNLYQFQLLPQIHEQAEASLTAYTNDEGDFAEVVRARIAELNAQIDALNINVERQKYIIQLNYFFMTGADQIVANNNSTGANQ